MWIKTNTLSKSNKVLKHFFFKINCFHTFIIHLFNQQKHLSLFITAVQMKKHLPIQFILIQLFSRSSWQRSLALLILQGDLKSEFIFFFRLKRNNKAKKEHFRGCVNFWYPVWMQSCTIYKSHSNVNRGKDKEMCFRPYLLQ